jgi:tetratricopeptide (TPR) repeat protein
VNKDLLVTVGGVLALGSVLFGAGLFVAGSALQSSTPAAPPVEEKSDAHATDAHAADEHASGEHGGGHEEAGAHGGPEAPSDADGPKVFDEGDLEYIQVLEKKYNDYVARGLYDEARSMALKGQNSCQPERARDWLRRLADATFMAEELAAHQRNTRAYELYSKLLAEFPASHDSEWPRYRAVQCLKNLHRWEEAAQAASTYLESFKSSSRAPEVMLTLAQCQLALGDRTTSRQSIEKLLALEDLQKDVRAAAMLELAHIERETPVHPIPEASGGAELVQLAELQTKPVQNVKNSDAANDKTSVDLSTLVPLAQWESIRGAAKAGNLSEAQRLISPWLDPKSPLNAAQRARIALDYASLLKELSNEK